MMVIVENPGKVSENDSGPWKSLNLLCGFWKFLEVLVSLCHGMLI